MQLRFKTKLTIILGFLALFSVLYMVNISYFRPRFNVSNVTSSTPYRQDWEVGVPNHQETFLLNTIISQPLTYLGGGGQAYAFSSADGRYVLKLFKFNRFRPSAFFEKMPDLPPFRSYFQKHKDRRSKKLETAFAGYKLAYEMLRQESGLLLVQLNPLPRSVIVTLRDQTGEFQAIDLQYIPFILQLKGEMLSSTLKELLAKGDLDRVKDCFDQLVALYLKEYSRGLYDLDRGLMHNIGSLEGKKLFHLDAGKLTYDEKMKLPQVYRHELQKVAVKIDLWLKKNTPIYASELSQYLHERIESLFDNPRSSENAA